jgi:hypothetical protein
MPRMTEPDRTPGTVLAATILLYAGGALTALYGLAGVRNIVYLPFGLLYVMLGWAVSKRKRWARYTVLVLCALGAAVGIIRLVGTGQPAAIGSLAWPVIYAVLLCTPSARAWFRQP